MHSFEEMLFGPAGMTMICDMQKMAIARVGNTETAMAAPLWVCECVCVWKSIVNLLPQKKKRKLAIDLLYLHFSYKKYCIYVVSFCGNFTSILLLNMDRFTCRKPILLPRYFPSHSMRNVGQVIWPLNIQFIHLFGKSTSITISLFIPKCMCVSNHYLYILRFLIRMNECNTI